MRSRLRKLLSLPGRRQEVSRSEYFVDLIMFLVGQLSFFFVFSLQIKPWDKPYKKQIIYLFNYFITLFSTFNLLITTLYHNHIFYSQIILLLLLCYHFIIPLFPQPWKSLKVPRSPWKLSGRMPEGDYIFLKL